VFNAVTGIWDPSPQLASSPPATSAPSGLERWTAKGTFRSTEADTTRVNRALRATLDAKGWKDAVIVVSSNEGFLGLPTDQTGTMSTLPRAGTKRADFEAAVRAAFASVDPGLLGSLEVYGSEVGTQVAVQTVKDLPTKGAEIVKDTLNTAGGAVWSALPWWAIGLLVVVGIGALLYLGGPLLVLLGGRRKS
jgi:hypothetical protein